MSENKFYNEYDLQTLKGSRPKDYRSAFQVDRDRVIHSSAFRKLQSKTQVYLSGEYDFYRTRLTHSIEVAQIGRSICHALKAKSEHLEDSFYIDSDLVEATCLSHDLGHPPFGHGGEKTLHRLFKDKGGFEGNAQTLRLLTETLYQSPSRQDGMTPTRSFIDGILKYKNLYSELDSPSNHFIYDFQLQYRDFAHERAHELQGRQKAGAFSQYSSIECQIMDWSDDTAYCINDIVDGVRARFITVERLENWAEKNGLTAETQPIFERFVNDIRRDRLEAVFGTKIGAFIGACKLVRADNALSQESNRYAFNLVVGSEIKSQARFYKKLAFDLIFKSAPLQQMDYKGDKILVGIFEALRDCYLGERRSSSFAILPEMTANLIKNSQSDDKWLIVRDYLASLTDGQALRIYKRLYDPEYASLIDLE
ncbi:dNTP triphosphohydrolase [Puniceicoccaceae bacterium K14]|nr:dNTP triphosphohydrolase [Puniceicoccaceae bacterium K14]